MANIEAKKVAPAKGKPGRPAKAVKAADALKAPETHDFLKSDKGPAKAVKAPARKARSKAAPKATE